MFCVSCLKSLMFERFGVPRSMFGVPRFGLKSLKSSELRDLSLKG